MEVDLDRMRETLTWSRALRLKSLYRLVELFPNEAAPLYSRALEFIESGHVNMAVMDLNKAIDIQPEAAALYFARAEALSELGERERAAEDCCKAIGLDPGQPSFYRLRARQYELQEKADLASRDIELAEVLEAEQHLRRERERKAEEVRRKAGL